MASPTVRQSAKTATLAQKLTASGTDTTIAIDVVSTDTWDDQAGVIKVGTGSSSEWISYTGVTTGSTVSGVTRQTLTGAQRGLKKNASSLSDVDTSLKKDNAIGAVVALVHHSAEINKLVQKDADESITGSVTFTNTTKSGLIVQSVTTTQRDAFTTTTNGNIIYNSTAGEFQVYQGGAWSTVSSGSTQPDASTTVAGKVEIATSAEKQALTGTGGTGALLVITNDDTERTLHPSNTNTTNKIVVAGGSTGNRSATLDFDVDDTNDYGLRVLRNSGVNGTTVITHDGTGDFQISMADNADFNLATTGDVKFDSPPLQAGTAGETLAVGDWVYRSNSDQKLYKADNNDTEIKSQVVGVVKVGGAADATVYVQTNGVVTGLTGLTANTRYYLDATAGAITSTRPSLASSTVFPVYIGYTDATTSLTIVNQRIPRRVFGTATQAANSSTTLTLTVGFPISHAIFHYTAPGVVTLGSGTIGTGYLGDGNGCSYMFIDENAGAYSGSNSGTDTVAIYILDLSDGSGTRKGTASVNGSNNIEIAWTDSGWATTTGTCVITWEAYEAL